MDNLDFGIFRYMSPRGEARFWGTRRLIDPRITPREIAQLLGVSQNGVRSRLRSLATAGYFAGTEVCPNPSLFDMKLVVAEVPVSSAAESQRLLADLGLVEGVSFVRDILDENDRKLRVHFVSDGPTTTQRRMALLRRLAPRGRVRDPTPYWVPPCDRPLQSLDWRVLQALRRAPDGTLGQIAESVGVTLKTAAGRYHRLLDSRACWWTHSQLSEEFPLALLSVRVEPGADRAAVATSVTQQTPNWMPVARDGLGSEPTTIPPGVDGLVPIETPARLESLVGRIVGLPSVIRVDRTFALGSRSYPEWFDREIDSRAGRR